MPNIKAEDLLHLTTSIFVAAGAPEDIAEKVATSLVGSNLRGHDSHGVIQTIKYVGKIRNNLLNPVARPQIEREQGAVTIIDCGWGFGQISAQFGADTAITNAQTFGICCVALTNVNHIARLGEYAERIANAGLIGIVLTSGASAGGSVSAFQGRDRIFGTNPMAWAVPVSEERAPLVADFATSATSLGKLDIALSKDVSIPSGQLLDRNAAPTIDPASFGDGGVLLPFGLYKGYGLLLMMEIIPTLLANFAPASSTEYKPGNPTVIIAMSIEAFTAKERFDRLVEELLTRVKTSQPAPDYEEVLLPGEPEARAMQERSGSGIPIPERTWQQLNELAEELGIKS